MTGRQMVRERYRLLRVPFGLAGEGLKSKTHHFFLKTLRTFAKHWDFIQLPFIVQ